MDGKVYGLRQGKKGIPPSLNVIAVTMGTIIVSPFHVPQIPIFVLFQTIRAPPIEPSNLKEVQVASLLSFGVRKPTDAFWHLLISFSFSILEFEGRGAAESKASTRTNGLAPVVSLHHLQNETLFFIN